MMVNVFYTYADVPVTEYEKERAQRMIRNNQVLQSLGVTQLASFLNSCSNGKSKRVACEDSDSLYERADDDEANEHGVVDKEKCLKAKVSRGKVQYPHQTGSRCYIAQTNVLEQMKAIMAEPTAEGQDPKTPAEAIAQVLPSSKFLQNVGLEKKAPNKTTATAARVLELEAEVQAERQDATVLRCQLEDLNSKFEEVVAAKEKQQEELDILKKQGEETNALLRRLLCVNRE
nr:unnamed protein product [Digitaria exilis]